MSYNLFQPIGLIFHNPRLNHTKIILFLPTLKPVVTYYLIFLLLKEYNEVV